MNTSATAPQSTFRLRLAGAAGPVAAALVVLGACEKGEKMAETGRGTAMSAEAASTISVVDPSPLNWLSITWNTMEELVRVDTDGNTVPNLAESWKWIDPKTLEFKLRRNVTFQDGEKFTAPVFRRSFDEVQRWKVPHPPGAFLNFDPQTKLAVLDDYTVRFTFPRTDAATIMKFRGMHVGSTKFWDTDGFVDKKTGTAESHW